MTRLLALGVALCVLVSVGATPDRHHGKPKKDVGQLRHDLSKLRKKKAQLRAELKTTKRAAKAVLSDIHVVDGQLTDLEGKLEDTGQQLTASKSEQQVVAEQLQEATKQLDQDREQVRQRIKRMYMQGDSSLLTVLVGAGDVGEISSRKFIMERIAQQDRHVFLAYVAARDNVRRKKSEADALVHRVAGLLDTQKHEQASLKDARHRKGQYLKELQAKQGELQEMLQQFEDDERDITSQIQSYMRSHGRVGKGGKIEPLPRYSGGAFIYPVNGRMTSGFGMRYHPILHITRMHAGCDFGAPVGTHIRAVADGVVIHSSYMNGYGNVIIVDHGGGLSTVYAHCSRIGVGDGQHVKRGQYIGNVGNTGLSTGPHLHFEVRVNGRPVNPRRYL